LALVERASGTRAPRTRAGRCVHQPAILRTTRADACAGSNRDYRISNCTSSRPATLPAAAKAPTEPVPPAVERVRARPAQDRAIAGVSDALRPNAAIDGREG
jgi:hypothetical protein